MSDLAKHLLENFGRSTFKPDFEMTEPAITPELFAKQNLTQAVTRFPEI